MMGARLGTAGAGVALIVAALVVGTSGGNGGPGSQRDSGVQAVVPDPLPSPRIAQKDRRRSHTAKLQVVWYGNEVKQVDRRIYIDWTMGVSKKVEVPRPVRDYYPKVQGYSGKTYWHVDIPNYRPEEHLRIKIRLATLPKARVETHIFVDGKEVKCPRPSQGSAQCWFVWGVTPYLNGKTQPS